MDRGRAAVFLGPGKPFELREYPLPDPPERGLVVRVTQGNICGSDLHFWRGDLGELGKIPPSILGHEGTGRIARLGDGVRTDSLGVPVREGDRIVWVYYRACDRCRPCLRGLPNACAQALLSVVRPCDEPPHFFGTFADAYCLLPGQKFFRVPDDLDDHAVAGANCALAQVVYGLEKAGLGFGETVVVQGAGGLGLYATAVAREMGAERIVVVDAIPERLELARELGADHVVDASEITDPRARTARVLELTDGWGADVVVEVVGSPHVIPEGIRMLARGGRYLEMGSIAPRQTYKQDPSILVGPNRSILGVSLYPAWALKKALDFLSRTRGRFPLERIASTVYPLEKIDEAFRVADAFSRRPAGVTRVGIRPEA
ncbi:MAG: zinc-binding alcohol dehydrogenase [Candidatus Binatia bacterium]|nr:MAG: zinc-binding alcohol dehydrogenase [Candidatus Binatia bacterium]